MIKNQIIIIGNNYDNLHGAKNDAILIFNYFYKIFQSKDNWYKPILMLDDDIVLKTLDLLPIDKLYIYYSGHSNKKGYLRINKKFVSKKKILKILNKKLKIKCEIFFLLDCCFGSNLILNKKYKNISKAYFLSASKFDEKSNEIVVVYNKKYYKIKKPNKINSTVIHGVFTFNLYKLLHTIDLNNFDSFSDLTNNSLWKIIQLECNQTISLLKFFF